MLESLSVKNYSKMQFKHSPFKKRFSTANKGINDNTTESGAHRFTSLYDETKQGTSNEFGAKCVEQYVTVWHTFFNFFGSAGEFLLIKENASRGVR